MKRVIFDIVLLLCIFTMPWWITIPLSFIGLFVFKQYYEFIITWIIMFSLFSIPGPRLISSPMWSAIIVGVLYIGIQALKRHIILYKNEI
jgi:hypothetical protein